MYISILSTKKRREGPKCSRIKQKVVSELFGDFFNCFAGLDIPKILI